MIWLAIPLILGLTLFGGSTIGIQLHDRYFVVSSIYVGMFFAICLGLIGFIYWLVRNKRLINWVTVVHVIMTIAVFVLIVLTNLTFEKAIQANFSTFRIVDKILFAVILFAAFTQLAFIANLILSLVRTK